MTAMSWLALGRDLDGMPEPRHTHTGDSRISTTANVREAADGFLYVQRAQESANYRSEYRIGRCLSPPTNVVAMSSGSPFNSTSAGGAPSGRTGRARATRP